MEQPEVIVGITSYPWRIEFGKRNMKVFQGSWTIIEIKKKYLLKLPIEDFLEKVDGVLQKHFKVKPHFNVIELEAKFSEWKSNAPN